MNRPNLKNRNELLNSSLIEVPISLRGKFVGRNQPITFGVPFPCGLVNDSMCWELAIEQFSTAVQHVPLSRWPDGSVKWLQVTILGNQLSEARANAFENDHQIVLRPLASLTQNDFQIDAMQLDFDPELNVVTVDTGAGQFRMASGDRLIECCKSSEHCWSGDFGGQVVGHDTQGRRHVVNWRKLSLTDSGSLCATVTATGSLGRTGLVAEARLTFHAGSNLIRVQVDIANQNRAKHQGGYWDLGDPGSVCLRDLSVNFDTGAMANSKVQWRDEPGGSDHFGANQVFEIYQDSSGGENWQSRNHVNRDGVVSTSFRGYQAITPDRKITGHRASPLVAIVSDNRYLACALEEFWQKFPSGIEINHNQLMLNLWPKHFQDSHELQGGERNSRTMWIDLGTETTAPLQNLEWVYDPATIAVDANWIADSEAIPFFPDPNVDFRLELETVLESAINGSQDFFSKRETIDEYGWRNFGDVWADHEQAFCEDSSPVISHYNNQYDLLNGALIQFLQTGDIRWWQVADPLARHVMAIDIYQTTQDKSAYNFGLFWHTAHYHDVGTCGHRSYSVRMKDKTIPAPGGGPSNEHMYSSGLLLYYFVTGIEQARDAVVRFGDWVIAIDDGGQHLLGAVSDESTGMASSTAETEYHGPGRGAGNSILTLLNAWLATSDNKYLQKAEELIHRTIHPADDVCERDLLNAELRWSYTVYLQALVYFIQVTGQLKEYSKTRVYARHSLSKYARWMTQNERLYLDQADQLEYPTETWAAQDLRKGVMLRMASAYEQDADIRLPMEKRSNEILNGAWNSLMAFPSRSYTRPIAIVLQQSYIERFMQSDRFKVSADMKEMQNDDFGTPTNFVPQKVTIKRQLKSPVGMASLAIRMMHPRSLWHLSQQGWAASRIRSLLRSRS